MNKMVEKCEQCGKTKDNRLPSRIGKSVPYLLSGIALLEIVSYLINPIGTIDSLMSATQLWSFIGFTLSGAIIGFGLFVYDIAGMAD